MPDTQHRTDEPVFYEALAAAAKCAPAEAKEHYDETATSDLGRAHPVEYFLEEYAA